MSPNTPPNNSPILIVTDETPPSWNNATESSAYKRYAPPTTTYSAPKSPIYTTSQEPLPRVKKSTQIITTDQTITSEYTPTNQKSLLLNHSQ